jgi:hypothetical protein
MTLERGLAETMFVVSLIMALDITLPTLPPMPWINLAIINVERSCAYKQTTDAAINKIIPEIIIGRLPTLSDKKPMMG